MENLNIQTNVKDSELGMIKIVLKLEIELKKNNLSEEQRKNIESDIINLKHMIESINKLHVLEEIYKEQIKFT